MTRNLTPQEVVLLLGTALVIGGLMLSIIYVLHKALRRQRQEINLNPARHNQRAGEPAFIIASMQDVVAKMKAREKELEGLLRDAEQRADTSTRTLEALAREMPEGLMVFDRDGFLTLANQAARTLLDADTWSRGRYPQILGPGSELSVLIQQCVENAKGCRRERLTHISAAGHTRNVEVSLSPVHGRSGRLAGAICLIPAAPDGIT